MLRDPIPPTSTTEEAARSVLRGNARVGLAGLLGGAIASLIGMPALDLPNAAILTGLGVLTLITLLLGGAMFFVIRRPPQFLVDRFLASLEQTQPARPIRVWTNRGAACMGALAFCWAFALFFVLSL